MREEIGGKITRDRPVGRLRNVWEHNTKIDDREIASDGMKCIPLAQDRHHGREIMLSELY
jgi:hypothetical protein